MTVDEVTRETIGQFSLDKIVHAVPHIYKEKDELRSVWDIWLHATHHAAAIGEEVRKYKPGETLLIEIADFAMWLFTFVGKIKGPFLIIGDEDNVKNRRIGEYTIQTQKGFSEILWNKYPRVCPVCYWRRYLAGSAPDEINKPCDCLLHDVENRDKVITAEAKDKKAKEKQQRVKELRNYANKQASIMPNTIDEWQDMFGDLYKANLRHISIVDIAFHLLEEVGEVSDAMVRMYSYNTKKFNGQPYWNQIWLEEEIADVFSWLVTLVNSLQIMPDTANQFLRYLDANAGIKFGEDKITLSRIIWRGYGSNPQKTFICRTCGKPECKCELWLVGQNIKYEKFLQFAE